MLTRRALLLGAMAGAAGLAGMRYWRNSAEYELPPLPTSSFLNRDDQENLAAFIPVFLNGVLSSNETTRHQEITTVIERIEASVQLLYPRTRDELRELFDGLNHAATRVILTSQTASITTLSIEERDAILKQWRNSFLALLNTAYIGIHNLVMTSFYGDSQHWHHLSYDGPPMVRDYGVSS